MQQLSQTDAVFVYSEKQRTPMHLSSLHIYDPATAPDGRVTFTQFVEHVRHRLAHTRLLRRKLARVPCDLDYPYWVEDRDFHLEFHVRHTALPDPGDWAELWGHVSRLHATPIDLTRPPWELYFIERLLAVEDYSPDSFGMYIKIHHSAIDGISGIELMNALNDISPKGRGEVVDTWRSEPDPEPLALLAMAGVNLMLTPTRVAQFASRAAPRALNVVGSMARRLGSAAPSPPATRLNQRVTTHRIGDGIAFDLDLTKRIKSTIPGVTVNDVVLAVVGGGLRQYLLSKDDLPEQTLYAGVPVSMRTEADEGTAGNKISMILVSLGTDVAGARERLEAVHDSALRQKELGEAEDARLMADYGELMPGALLGLAVRANDASTAKGTTAQIGNVCVTNVPGSQAPLYVCGAQMLAYYSLGPVYDNAGPIHLVVSYLGKIYLSVTTCHEIMPDLAFYIECLRNSLSELADATLGPDARRAVATPSKAPVKKVAKRAVKKDSTAAGTRSRARADGAGRPPARRPRDREVR